MMTRADEEALLKDESSMMTYEDEEAKFKDESSMMTHKEEEALLKDESNMMTHEICIGRDAPPPPPLTCMLLLRYLRSRDSFTLAKLTALNVADTRQLNTRCTSRGSLWPKPSTLTSMPVSGGGGGHSVRCPPA